MKFLHNPGLKFLKQSFTTMLKVATTAETKSEHETELKSRNSSCTLTEDKAESCAYSSIKVLLAQVVGKMSSGAVSLKCLRTLLGLKQDSNFQVAYGGKMC